MPKIDWTDDQLRTFSPHGAQSAQVSVRYTWTAALPVVRLRAHRSKGRHHVLGEVGTPITGGPVAEAFSDKSR